MTSPMNLILENHCRNSYERLLLLQPHVHTDGLWRSGSEFFIVCPGAKSLQADDGTPIEDWFLGHAIMGVPIQFVATAPPSATRIPTRSARELAQGRGGG